MRHLVVPAHPQVIGEKCAGLDIAKAARAAVARAFAQHESLAESYAHPANDHEDLAAPDPDQLLRRWSGSTHLQSTESSCIAGELTRRRSFRRICQDACRS